MLPNKTGYTTRLSLALSFLLAGTSIAQEGGPGVAPRIEELKVTATRAERQLGDVPMAVSVVDRTDVQRGRQQLGLDEALNRVPGLFSQNRYNFTADLRLAIRGFGARSNFGIRGLKILADGIPATLADGQSGVDDIDMGGVDRIEVTRGPSSSLYGASSGGVINLFTEDGPETPFVEAAVTGGEFDQQKYQLKAGGQTGNLNYLANASHLTYGGYRDHARVEATQLNSKFRYDIDADSELRVIFNLVDSPTADDPGAITATDIITDRQQAQPRNLSSNAGEKLTQQKIGFVYNRAVGNARELTIRNYYLWRDFASFLPIGTHIRFVPDDGVVEFDRFFWGGGVEFRFSSELLGRPLDVVTGIDFDIQKDNRQRFLNNAGVKGALSFDQVEEAKAVGGFVRNDLGISDTVTLSLGLRYDHVDLSVSDHFLTNADQSGSINFNEVNPTFGLLWNVNPSVSVYANYATSFETPTFTELASPARNLDVSLGGFNNVTPQQAKSVEAGLRGGFLKNRLFVDIAAFSMRVDNEITSVSNIGSRSFFENADTDRKGFEAYAAIDLAPGLIFNVAYTYSDFKFDSFDTNPTFAGNRLPGLPDNQLFAELQYDHAAGFYIVADMLYVDTLQANNANTVATNPTVVANVRMGATLATGRWRIDPFIGINNVFSEKYMSNVRINGFGGRLFEPGPERNIYGGVKFRYEMR